ncbi:MAG: hypothetical protein ACOCRK_09900, partial [bacterium]
RDAKEFEKKLNRKVRKIVSEKITEFDKKMAVTGLLLELFRAAELNNQVDICYYIQTKYLWPIMKCVPWEEKSRTEVQLMGIMLGYYVDFITSLELSRNSFNHIKNTNLLYTDKDFIEEFIGNKPGILSKTGINLAKKYRHLGKSMAEAMSLGKHVIKKLIINRSYSFLMTFIPYLLYFSGDLEEARLFLIRNYKEINLYDGRNLFIQLTLIKCILSCEKLEEANILYGYFNYELDRQEREENPIAKHFRRIIQYLKDVEHYLKLSDQCTRESNKPLVNVVFKNTKVIKNINLAKSYLEKEQVPPIELFRKLMTYVEAFSRDSYIRLNLIEIPNVDGSDKLPNALSHKLIVRGQGLRENSQEYYMFYQSIKLQEVRRNINLFLQRHISKLLDLTIEDSMEKIKSLRSAFLDNKGSKITDLNDSDTEELINLFDDVMKDLTAKLEGQYIHRTDVDSDLYMLQREFIKKYNLKISQNTLVELLPLKVQSTFNSFLVTSEIVYEVLSNRNDVEELDFSSALIPLTKALELLLNLVFKNMSFALNDIDKFSIYYYFDKGKAKRKKTIALGPCINLLKDSHQIDVKKVKNDYRLSWQIRKGKNSFDRKGCPYFKNKSRFLAINGDKVINFNRLKMFKGLSMIIQISYNNLAQVAFTESKEQNRMILIKALEYVLYNYRNKVAHKDGISLQKVNDCREILLQSHNLLWILLYIIDID